MAEGSAKKTRSPQPVVMLDENMTSGNTGTTCRICRKRPADSREHLPAKAVGNLGPVEVFYLDSSLASGQRTEYRTTRFDNGFWVEPFCQACNKLSGRRYVTAYQQLVSAIDVSAGIRDTEGRLLVFISDAYPLRVLKQMFAMFLASLPRQPDAAWTPIQDFVRLRNSTLPGCAPDVYLYHNESSHGRIVPCCGFIELASHEKLIVSEISWPPLGMVFSFQESRRFNSMQKVSSWGQLPFSERRPLKLALPSLKVSTPFPLVYGSRSAAERERNERGHAYLIQVHDEPGRKIDVAAQLRRLK